MGLTRTNYDLRLINSIVQEIRKKYESKEERIIVGKTVDSRLNYYLIKLLRIRLIVLVYK